MKFITLLLYYFATGEPTRLITLLLRHRRTYSACYLIALLPYYLITSVSAEEESNIVSLTGGTTRQIEIVVESSDRKPVVKLLKPDYGEICGSIIPDNYFTFQYTGDIQPDIQSLTADTPAALHSPGIPLVWSGAGKPFYYGRFLIKNNANVKKWEIRVVDSRGKKIIQYDGTGKPPEIVDLKEEDISKFYAGKPYSAVLSLTAENGKKYRFYGNVFSFDLLIKERKESSVSVELDSKALFDDNTTALTEKGRDIILGLNSFLLKLKNPSVEIITRTSREKISGIRTYTIVDILNKEFFIPMKNIKADLHIYSEIDYPLIEIIIKSSS